MIRRRTNHITSIQTGPNTTASTWESIGEAFTGFFRDLFTSTQPVFPADFELLILKSLSQLDCTEMEDIPSCEEIREVVFSMKNGKSPGPDSLPPFFISSIGMSSTINLYRLCSSSLPMVLYSSPSITHLSL